MKNNKKNLIVTDKNGKQRVLVDSDRKSYRLHNYEVNLILHALTANEQKEPFRLCEPELKQHITHLYNELRNKFFEVD